MIDPKHSIQNMPYLSFQMYKSVFLMIFMPNHVPRTCLCWS